MIPPAYADVAPAAPVPRPSAPVSAIDSEATVVITSGRSLALMVTEEEAEALMAVLLLAPLENGRTGDAMECVLSKLADIQRAFSRAE